MQRNFKMHKLELERKKGIKIHRREENMKIDLKERMKERKRRKYDPNKKEKKKTFREKEINFREKRNMSTKQKWNW